MHVLLMINSFFSLLIALLFFLPAYSLQACPPLSDHELLLAKFDISEKQDSDDIVFLQSGSDRLYNKYNPLRLALAGMMFVYQRFVSPQIPADCLYHTSCSNFSILLIQEYGMIKGSIATADRLMRCNRIAVFDIHPMQIHEESGRATESTGVYRRRAK